MVPFCVSLTVSGPGAETALGTAGTALPSGWRFGSLVTLRPHTWEWVTGWNDTPSGLRVQCQAHPCARGPASKFSAVPLRGAPNEEPGLPTPCAHPLGLQGGVLGGTAAWRRGSCPQPPTCTPAQAPAPPLARHPAELPELPETGVLQGLLRADPLVRVVGHHGVQEREALWGQIGCQ